MLARPPAYLRWDGQPLAVVTYITQIPHAVITMLS
jgi:hypothetical protein